MGHRSGNSTSIYSYTHSSGLEYDLLLCMAHMLMLTMTLMKWPFIFMILGIILKWLPQYLSHHSLTYKIYHYYYFVSLTIAAQFLEFRYILLFFFIFTLFSLCCTLLNSKILGVLTAMQHTSYAFSYSCPSIL